MAKAKKNKGRNKDQGKDQSRGRSKGGSRSAKRGRRNSSNLPWILGGIGVLALIALPIIINLVRSAGLPGESFPSQGNIHIQLGADHPPYNSDPPTSGWHTGDLAPWQSYDFVVPDERLIHNLEDGGVILWYPLGSEEENREHIEALEEIARGYRNVIIAPREGMPTTYTLTAWQRLQRFESLDPEGMQAFLEAFEGVDHHARF